MLIIGPYFFTHETFQTMATTWSIHPSQVVSNPISKKTLRLFGRGPTTLFRESIEVMVINPRSTSHGMIL